MDLKKSTIHVVIAFEEKNEEGKVLVELLPKCWIHKDKIGHVYCKYPEKKDYGKLRNWVKKSVKPEETWISHKISILSEAHDFSQGLRRLNRSFSDTVIASSNLDQSSTSNSSVIVTEEEEEELKQQSATTFLKNIPFFKLNESHSIQKSKETYKRSSTSSADSMINNSNFQQVVESIDNSYNESVSSIDSEHKSERKCELKRYRSRKRKVVGPLQTSPKRPRKNEGFGPSTSPTFKVTILNSSVSPDKSSHRKESFTKLSSPPDQNLQQIESRAGMKKKPKSTEKSTSEFGSISRQASAEMGFLEEIKKMLNSIKRSILYDLNRKTNEILLAIKGKDSAHEISSIISKINAVELPKRTLQEFLDFDEDLVKDEDASNSFKFFVTMNAQKFDKSEEAICSILPKIMVKDVQRLYSAYGRVTKGAGKLNFSITNTCKIFQDVLLLKFPDSNVSNIMSKVSRWFSGANDREGGKKERLSSAAMSG